MTATLSPFSLPSSTILTHAARPKLPDPVEEWFTSWDGTELFYRAWWPGGAMSLAAGDAGSANGALILFHRGHEHSGRFSDLIEQLGCLERGVPVFAWDARGHGKSPGERGHAPSFMALVRDVEAFIRHLSGTYHIPISDMSVLAHSVGSVAVAAWVHDYAPPLRKLVLVAPAFRVKLYVPLARTALKGLRKIKPTANVKSYVTGKLLTHDAEQAVAYDSDPLISKQIAVNILLDMHDTATRLIADAGAIGVPTFILTAGKDYVVKNTPIQKFFDGLSSPTKLLKNYPSYYHAILNERDRLEPISDIKQFLAADVAPRKDTRPEEIYTRREYQQLVAPLPYGLRAMKYAVQRKFMSTLGKLSEGIRIGLASGFDSGESLDHVYKDSAKGKWVVGKVIDREYIDTIGWRGIRQRRVHLNRVLDDAILRIRREHERWKGAVRIMDIAAGPGRYLLETLLRHPRVDIIALLRDWSESGIAEARKLAQQMNIARARFERADAFSENDVAAARVAGSKPNIAVVSGLYELFPENPPVEASLRGLARALDPGALLVYTCQPWHPQMEMIANTLHNREGKPWIMRRRTQSEMDRLVRDAGFEKLRMEIDDWGIFTVSLAQRRA